MRKILLLTILFLVSCAPASKNVWKSDDTFEGVPAVSLSSIEPVEQGKKPATIYFYCQSGRVTVTLDAKMPVSFNPSGKYAKIQVSYGGKLVDAEVKTEDGVTLFFGPEGSGAIAKEIAEKEKLSIRARTKDMSIVNIDFDALSAKDVIDNLKKSCS